MNLILTVIFYLGLAGCLAGATLLWVVRLMGAHRNKILRVLAWTLLVKSALWLGLVVLQFSMLLAAPLLLFVVLATLFKYREAERRILFGALVSCAGSGAPLWKAAQGFALERVAPDARPSWFGPGGTALRLAQRLRGGASLRSLFHDMRLRPDIDTRNALLIATELDRARAQMRDDLRRVHAITDQWRQLAFRAGYLALLLASFPLALTFVSFVVTPQIGPVFQEFDIASSPAANATIQLSWVMVAFGMVLLPVNFGAWCVLTFNLFDRDVIAVNAFAAPLDRSRVMRALAWAMQDDRGDAERNADDANAARRAVELFAAEYPKFWVRARLKDVGVLMDRGQGLVEAMRSQGLLASAEQAVLQSAIRVGNLSWALCEMADRRLMLFERRLRGWYAILFPAAVLGVGLATLGFALQIMIPMSQAIVELSQ